MSIDSANNSDSIDILDNDAAGEGEGELIPEVGAVPLDFIVPTDRSEFISAGHMPDISGDSVTDRTKLVDLVFAAKEPIVASGDELVEFATQLRDASKDLIAAIDAAMQDDILADSVV